MYYVGIDNGVSGSLGIVSESGEEAFYHPMPTKSGQDYTKAKKNITRIDYPQLVSLLTGRTPCKVFVERPMVNPRRFVATTSAVRALEAVLIACEGLVLPYQFIDSRQWQRVLLPQGVEGPELKKASLDIGSRLFPSLAEVIKKQGDADGLLIAEFARRSKL